MKLRLAGFVLSVLTGCIVSAVAGSAAGGGAQIAPTDNASVSTYKPSTSSIPGGNAYDSAGASGNPSASSGASTGTSGAPAGGANNASGSSFGNGSANGSAFSGPSGTSSNPARANAEAAAALKKEKVVDTGDKHFETNASTNSQSKDKTFSAGLLDSANDIAAVGKGKEQAATDKSTDVKAKTAANDNSDSDKKK